MRAVVKPSREKLTRSELMRRVRSRGTTPELLLQTALRASGLRFQTYVETLPGKPDIVFRTKRLAVFVDGEFWHGIQWQRRGLSCLEEQFVDNPAREYWIAKIGRNQQRDRASTAALIQDGWTVIRFWEGEVRRDARQCVTMIIAALENAVFTPAAVAPFKTFTSSPTVLVKTQRALESLGWRAAESSMATMSLAALPLKPSMLTTPFVIIETSPRLVTQSGGKDLARALRVLNRHGYGVDALYAGAPRRLFIIGVIGLTNAVMPDSGRTFRSGALAAFIARHPRMRWNFHLLPSPLGSMSAIRWISDNYLDPAITEIIRGRVLRGHFELLSRPVTPKA